MDSCLIVVSRRWPELLQHLQGRHVHLRGVEIILDRRERQLPIETGTERRGPSRIDTDLERQAFVVIPRP